MTTARWPWHEVEQLRAVHLADQAEGARLEAAEWVAGKAAAAGSVVNGAWKPSAWVLKLLKDSRRNRCQHWPAEGHVLVFVLAGVRSMQCRPCTAQALATLADSLDRGRCDVCRESAGELTPFAFHAGATAVVTGQCCSGCLPTVTGGAA